MQNRKPEHGKITASRDDKTIVIFFKNYLLIKVDENNAGNNLKQKIFKISSLEEP